MASRRLMDQSESLDSKASAIEMATGHGEYDTLVDLLEALGVNRNQVPPLSEARVIWH